jgi:hypothetical protein
MHVKLSTLVFGAIEIESLPSPRTHSFSDPSLDASIHQVEYNIPPEPNRPTDEENQHEIGGHSA